MKYYFNPSKLHKRFLPYVIASLSICVLIAIINRLYNTISETFSLSDTLLLLFVLSLLILIIILFFYRYYYKKYKNSYISVHNGQLKHRRNNMRNFMSEWNEFPEYVQYQAQINDFKMSNNKIIIYGNVESSLIYDTEFASKKRSIDKIVIPSYFDNWDKIIKNLNNNISA